MPGITAPQHIDCPSRGRGVVRATYIRNYVNGKIKWIKNSWQCVDCRTEWDPATVPGDERKGWSWKNADIIYLAGDDVPPSAERWEQMKTAARNINVAQARVEADAIKIIRTSKRYFSDEELLKLPVHYVSLENAQQWIDAVNKVLIALQESEDEESEEDEEIVPASPRKRSDAYYARKKRARERLKERKRAAREAESKSQELHPQDLMKILADHAANQL